MFWKYYSCLSAFVRLAGGLTSVAGTLELPSQMSRGRAVVTSRQGHQRHIWDTRSPFPMEAGHLFDMTSWQWVLIPGDTPLSPSFVTDPPAGGRSLLTSTQVTL